jgi:hypothetical protein
LELQANNILKLINGTEIFGRFRVRGLLSFLGLVLEPSSRAKVACAKLEFWIGHLRAYP